MVRVRAWRAYSEDRLVQAYGDPLWLQAYLLESVTYPVRLHTNIQLSTFIPSDCLLPRSYRRVLALACEPACVAGGSRVWVAGHTGRATSVCQR